jgi:hypothetical protein
MTGQDLARIGNYGRSTLTEKQQYAVALSRAGELVPRNFWTKPAPDGNGGMIPAQPNPGAILYMLETAAMIGVNPMVGLTNIHIIEGKPSLSANLQAALVREAGHRLRVWVEGKTAICEIVRSDDPEFTFRVEWGDAEMNAAGLGNKDNWKKYQRSMKKARAITECIREACPEVLMGATYSPDELGANTDEMGEPIDLQQVPDANATPPVSRETSGGKTRTAAPIVDDAPSQGGTEEHQQPADDTPVDEATGEVKDEKPAVTPETFPWAKAIEEAKTSDDVKALYRSARAGGVLNLEIRRGRQPKRVLGPWLEEVGKAMVAAEEQADREAAEAMVFAEAEAEQAEAKTEEAEDPNVVDAEVVDDGSDAPF